MPKTFKTQWFHILLALAERERHGYGIQREVLDRTDGELMLWPATLYSSLATLTERGLIEPLDRVDETASDERRQYYGITDAGRRRLTLEANRMAAWAEAAVRQNRLRATE